MLNRKAQSTLEYAIIVSVVIGGLLVMQHYVKRGYQGRLKGAGDQMGEQFDPGAYTADFNITSSSTVNETTVNGTTETKYTADAISNKTGNENISAWDAALNAYGK